MKTVIRSAVAAIALLGATQAQAATEIVVQYPYGDLFTETHKIIADKFMAANPDIKVTFRAPYESYEDATQKVMREAVTNTLPDVTYQGLNRMRVLVDRGIAQPLDGFIGAEENVSAEGFHQAMFDIGTFNGGVYGLPFAVSLPIAYYNIDLVKKAGGNPDDLPDTWDEAMDLAKKIDALGDDITGMSYAWDITGNWLWQAPVMARGGAMLDASETRVAFDGPEGKVAMADIARMVTDAKMPDMAAKSIRSTFAAGQVGMWFYSTSTLAKLNDMIGDKFTLKTGPFPGVVADKGRLPAGGNGAVMTATTPEKQAAAWKYIKFATGPVGAAVVPETTGYMAPNLKAEEVLVDFYAANPNHTAALKQLPLMTGWYAFPGDNGLKITDVIKDHLQTVASGQRAGEPDAVLADMARDVQALLPKTH